MHLGRVLVADGETDTVVFTDWMPRQGDHAVFTADLIASIEAQFTVEIFHKNSEDTGPGAWKATLASATTTLGLHPATVSNLKEMVRYRITVSGNGSGKTAAVIYRLLQITWFDTARV